MATFSDVVDSADALSIDEQETLISILQQRIREHRRSELVKTVREAQKEFEEGKCKTVSVEEIIKMTDI